MKYVISIVVAALLMTGCAAGVARLLSAAGVTVIVAISPAEGSEIPGTLVAFEAAGGTPGEDWVI